MPFSSLSSFPSFLWTLPSFRMQVVSCPSPAYNPLEWPTDVKLKSQLLSRASLCIFIQSRLLPAPSPRLRLDFHQLLWTGQKRQNVSSESLTCCVLSCSVVSNSVTSWTAACQAPLSMGFSRQECWSGLLCPPPRDLLNPGIEPVSLSLADKILYH